MGWCDMGPGRAYLALLLLGALLAVGSFTGSSPAVLAQAALPAIDLPMPAQGVAVDPTTNRLYVSVSPPIWVVDADTHAVLARYYELMARMGPVAVNPLTNRVDTGMVSGAGRTNTTLATVPVGARPFFVATNPITNRVYVASNDPDGPM